MDRYERVRLTNPDKVLYPAAVGGGKAVTKAQVFEHYVSNADRMVPHIAGRPGTRKPWPNRVHETSFFQKQLPSPAPDLLAPGTVPHKTGPTPFPINDTREGLAWIA